MLTPGLCAGMPEIGDVLRYFSDFKLIGEQSGDDPQIVAEDSPSDGEVAVIEAATAQPAPLALFEDRDASLGRSPAILQSDETVLRHALAHRQGVAGTEPSTTDSLPC